MIIRDLQPKIEANLFKDQAIVLIGARQVGKTTLMQQLVTSLNLPTIKLNCDEPEPREWLTNTNVIKLKQLLDAYKLVIIDEAQRVPNIGLTLKLIIDNLKDTQVIVTASSAFEISNEINEPLTGHKYEYNLFPVSVNELVRHTNLLAEYQSLEKRLIFGCYPKVIVRPNESKDILLNLTSSYLFKDIFVYFDVKRPALLEKLVQALALQVGSEVSYNELGQIIQADNQTVERYIDLLEKNFVVFRLGAFSRNLRNELKKTRKIYFYDNGIRNAIIQRFSPLELRDDIGALWENFIISERVKQNHYARNYAKMYFWRNTYQQEIDLIEESDGQFSAYEIKWNENKKVRFPKQFLETYPVKETKIITPKNYLEFLS